MPDPIRYQKAKRSIACRECQRLKLKCNKSWPCDHCIKRGAKDICPEGVLPTTRQQRTDFIETCRLYKHNAQMSERIRELEAGLATLQTSVSHEPHPLLKKELLALGNPLSPSPVIDGIGSIAAPQSVEDTIQAFGTLAIGVNGRTTFHSQGVSVDYLVEPTRKSIDRPVTESLSLTTDILNLARLFPFGDSHSHSCDLKDQILSFLPPLHVAVHIAKNYYNYFSWWLDPIPREQFDREIFPILTSPPDLISADRLSVLFMILGIGTFLDVENPVDITLAHSNWHLSRAAFCLEPFVDASTTYTIQALQLMAAYVHMTDRIMIEHQWVIMGLIARIVHGSGLHYDGELWLKNIKDDRIVERRRKIFYEALSYDAMMSFRMGRPAAYSLAHIQAKLPLDEETVTTEPGVEEYGLSTWRYRFTKECLYPVMDEAFGGKPPGYSTILRLDRMLREFPVPSHLTYPGLGDIPTEPNSGQIPIRQWMQRAHLFGLRESNIDDVPGLLYLHRLHFSQALLDNPIDPLEGRYAASVLAAFRSASRIVAGVRDISSRYGALVSRIWWIWQNLFAAGIILATLVLRAPKCKLAQTALNGLSLASELMQHRALPFRSEQAGRVLKKLRKCAVSVFKTGQPVTSVCGMGVFDSDELVLITPVPRTFSYENLPEMDAFTPSPPEETCSPAKSLEWPNIHPDLMQTINSVHPSPSGISTEGQEGNERGTNVEQSFLPLADIIPHPGDLEFPESSRTYVDQTGTSGQWGDFMTYHANGTL